MARDRSGQRCLQGPPASHSASARRQRGPAALHRDGTAAWLPLHRAGEQRVGADALTTGRRSSPPSAVRPAHHQQHSSGGNGRWRACEPRSRRRLPGRATGVAGGRSGDRKTRLTEEFATEARARGVRVLVGRCHEDRGNPPFWPWVQIVPCVFRRPETRRAGAGVGTRCGAHRATHPRGTRNVAGPANSPGAGAGHARFSSSMPSPIS